jgi:hypothetical protein
MHNDGNSNLSDYLTYLTPELEILKEPLSNLRIDSEEFAHQLGVILRSQFGCSVCNLRVTIGDDGLLLEGTVGSYHSKQIAQYVAKKVSGDMVAANHIHVRQVCVGSPDTKAED